MDTNSMLSKIKEVFRVRRREEYTPPTEVQIEGYIQGAQIQDLMAVKIKEAEIGMSGAKTQVLEAEKNMLLARIEGTKWRNDKKAGRVDAAKQMHDVQEACYLYGNRYELLQEELKNAVRDNVDTKRELRDKTIKLEDQRSEMVSEFQQRFKAEERRIIETRKKLQQYDEKGMD